MICLGFLIVSNNVPLYFIPFTRYSQFWLCNTSWKVTLQRETVLGHKQMFGRHFPLGFMVTASISNKRSCGYARLKEDTSMIKMAAMFLRNSLYNQSVGIDNRRWWLDQRIDNLV